MVTNIENIERQPENITIQTTLPVKSGLIYTFEDKKGKSITIKDGIIKLNKVTDGAIIVLK